MATREQMILAVNDLHTAVAEGMTLYDGSSSPLAPEAPEEHYDKLARAIVAFTTTRGDYAAVIRSLSHAIRSIESMAQIRAWLINQSPADQAEWKAVVEAQLTLHHREV